MNRTDKEPGVSASQSPRFFRRKFASQVSSESSNTSQGKVVLGEVEEKLKSMKQKRFDRLSTFIGEQTKLFEEGGNKVKEGIEIEDAITSMRQAGEEKKTSFKSIFEERVAEKKEEGLKDKNNCSRTPKLSRKNSNEFVDKSKQSSTKKFISKFNCTTTQSVGSSIEDLTSDYDIKSDTVASRYNYNKPQVVKRTSLEEDKNKAVESTTSRTENIPSYNPLLSPVGKQRKGIYLYETECKFLENEKSSTMFTFTKTEKTKQQEVPKKFIERPNSDELKKGPSNPPLGQTSTNRSFLENKKKEFNKISIDNKPNVEKKTPGSVILEVKTRNSYESRSTASDNQKPTLLMKTFKRNSAGDILEGKSIDKINFNQVSVDESRGTDNKSYYIKKTEVTNQQGYAKISKHSNLTNYKNIDLEFQQNEKTVHLTKKNGSPNGRRPHPDNFPVPPKSPMPLPRGISKDNFPIPPKSPMPIPRRVTNEERILKKFQRNWDSLHEITENDSDVDSDEIEDLKNTFEEVNTLLVEYCAKLNKLERKSKVENPYFQKLSAIREELDKIGEEITKFKGLKRDPGYRELSNKLSNCFLEINKIKSNKLDIHSKKYLVLKQADNWVKILESRVVRNQDILFEVLEAQVSSISTNIFNITKV